MRLRLLFKKILKLLPLLLLLFVIYATLSSENYYERKISVKKELSDEKLIVTVRTPAGKITELLKDDSPIVGNVTIVTQSLYPDIVIYNRVPKCGSSTLRFLIKRLQVRNHFNHQVHNWPNVKQSLTAKEEAELAGQISSFSRPVLFLRHLHYVDFQKYNFSTKPVYFNMIRNPVDRFVSHFYFSRYGFQGWDKEKIDKWLWPMSDERRNMTIEECVQLGIQRCIEMERENLLSFFCGQDERCRKRDEWALQTAKKNIERDYAFIGILERLEDSLKIAEVILPRYFENAAFVQRQHPEGGGSTKTANKKDPTPSVRKALEEGLALEMDLYKFVVQRFDKQYEMLLKMEHIS